MCGICGIFERRGQSADPDILHRMNDTLVHRGPDGAGLYTAGAVGLAMRRLSIIDLAGSDQPLYNEDQQIVLVFNGEIYNFRALRAELEQRGHHFRTGGDGETIVHLYEEYGADAPRYLRGQFAFSLWDARQERLLLARDITGEKPLYYAITPERVLWGSEIKALLAHPLMPRRSRLSDPYVLAHYLTHGSFSHESPFVGIESLPPAHTAIITRDTVIIQPYWQAPMSALPDPAARLEDYLPAVRAALENAVDLTMIADVPLGAFLSGGVDSSLIVAMMQQRSGQRVHTFSIGFEGDDSFDETPYARQVADLLGTEHTEFRVKPDMLDILPTLVSHHDQPFADSSALPMYFVSQLTRQQVTVALTGDGGDEMFAGYERFYALSLVERLSVLPRSLWQVGAHLVDLLPEGTGYYNRIKRAGRFVRSASLPLHQAYLDYVRIFTAEQVKALAEVDYDETARIRTSSDALHYNLTTYLPDDLLVKTDRMSMAVSLEARSPFLYQDVLEAAFAVPFNLKLRGSTTKYLLKELARQYLPASIVDRPKHGFGVPVGAWIQRDSRMVEDLLLGHTSRLRDMLPKAHVTQLLHEHRSGQRDHARRLWALMTLEIWQQRYFG